MRIPLPLHIYHAATTIGAPFIRVWLKLRRLRGKEDYTRFHERFGYPSIARPQGPLVWCHAASVGEMMSALHLLKSLRTQRPDLHILLTTGTVTSARLAASKMPEGVFHQFSPIDTAASIDRFLNHWKPDLAIWIESELWPHMLLGLRVRNIPALLANGRLSERSARRWNRLPRSIRSMLSTFTAIYAGSPGDAERYRAIGAMDVHCPGNLKYDAPALPADANALAGLSTLFGARPLWCAASTHPGEEKLILDVHKKVTEIIPGLLTVIVPRHPARGPEIAELFEREGLSVARRSAGEGPSRTTPIYLSDTMGELGNLFRLCQIVFMGGSLVKRGGHNIIEPARLGCAIISGPYIHNFTEIMRDFESADAITLVPDATALTATLIRYLQDGELRSHRAASATAVVHAKSGAARAILKHALQLLPPETERGYVRAS